MRAPLDFTVPILNAQARPFRAQGVYLMVNVTCACQADNGPMLIRGHDVIVQCGRCHAKFGIASVSFDRAAGDLDPRVEVGLLARGA